MTLAPTLQNVVDLYAKLEREAYRTLHSRTAIHKADHFFNFCVTAHSMRDYFLEHYGLHEKKNIQEKKKYQDCWNENLWLMAAGDIANSVKHFQLRHSASGAIRLPKTREVSPAHTDFCEVYERPNGSLRTELSRRPSYEIQLSNGKSYDLHIFILEVKAFWKQQLAACGLHIQQQDLSQFNDS